ncbi:hypothetical protein [Dokdonella immobilis]|uniref:Ribosomal protein L7/L12 C-terminal domain-containing protein n=1 Tax=Dokdonella immobilis TaxID=578942 RepID=A0A1I4YHZ0_9GAMM|nr:hypothetical protein [Dokdonella immobilis]SFN37453.1 Ribosomal protein L7/L12 C-terminal domain-containing protein [Dokdonella immobilis]
MKSTIEVPPTASDLARRGNLIEAIKLTREHTGCSLIDAKEAVEASVQTRAVSSHAETTGADANSGDIPLAAILALQKGRLIDAIKHIREASGLGLKESKERVDAWLERNPQALARFKAEASAEMKRFIRKVSVFLTVALLALLAYLSLRAGI